MGGLLFWGAQLLRKRLGGLNPSLSSLQFLLQLKESTPLPRKTFRVATIIIDAVDELLKFTYRVFVWRPDEQITCRKDQNVKVRGGVAAKFRSRSRCFFCIPFYCTGVHKFEGPPCRSRS
jgi:hypothetical protein